MKNKKDFNNWLNKNHEPFIYIRKGFMWLNIIFLFLIGLWSLLNITPELNQMMLTYILMFTFLRIIAVHVYLNWVLKKKFDDELKN